MAWLKKDSRLRGHPKVITAAGALGIKPVYLQGHLDSMWLAALERQEDGDFSRITNEAIAVLAEYNPKDADRFVQVLQEHGLLEGRLIHDWLDAVGDYLKRKYRKSPAKLMAIYEKHGRGHELKREDTSGTCTGRVPDTSGTCQEVDRDIDLNNDPPSPAPTREISARLLNAGQAIALTPEGPLSLLLMDYEESWIIPAIKTAVLSGKRDWNYVRAILMRYAREGGPPKDERPQRNPRSGQAAAHGKKSGAGKFSGRDDWAEPA